MSTVWVRHVFVACCIRWMEPLDIRLSNPRNETAFSSRTEVGSEVEASIGHLLSSVSSTCPSTIIHSAVSILFSSLYCIQLAMSAESLIFRPLLLVIHAADLLLNLPSVLHSSTPRTSNREKGSTPRHVAFSFVTPDHSEDALERLKDVVRDLAAWAAEAGIEEVSLWNEDGEFLFVVTFWDFLLICLAVGLFDDGFVER